ncbi:hypothetical protein SVIO_052550 [Streptomyces violaceusniger]|uniref:ApeI dehydratase-like domain-containing protein n=1 Tax=Streptomyces violaceusniger TaxID=68280 RepID=A0A4D4L0N0_STRVO|nr:hypothetical protein SVIO_052550 [Streptomyces violaceusniger]
MRTATADQATDVTAARISPVTGEVRIVSALSPEGRAATRVPVSPREPVFAGHYPDFPIFPGVCVMECVHRSALATAPEPVELAAVKSARFAAPAFPGDVLDIDLIWARAGGAWRLTATAATARGATASLRLRYRAAGSALQAPAGPAAAAPAAALPGMPEPADLLPHRYPMLLVDRVLSLRPGERITAVKAVTHNEPWYAALVPAQDLAYPASLLIESWGQSAGLLASAATPRDRDQVMLFGAVAGAEFHRPVFPGELLEHHITIARSLDDSVIFEGRAAAARAP